MRHASNTCLIIRSARTTFGAMSEDSSGTREGLTERQRTILDVIRASVERRGYPPSIREIGDAVGLTSTSSVSHQLKMLQRKGYLHRDANRPRAVGMLANDGSGMGPGSIPSTVQPVYVPLVGRIAAGGPILAEQTFE